MATSNPVRPGTMEAWILERYGSPANLALREVPYPTFRDDHEVLVRVRAASLNPLDRHMLDPPFFLRRGEGFRRPRTGRVGSDLAGTVELVGAGVPDLRVGDEVFGVGRGGFAAYAVADRSQLVPKPARLTFEEAAAIPIAAVTALQGLRDRAQLRPGQRVLVNGASGGVGTFAVQIAQALGARVSSVCSPPNVEWNRSRGVERVFDYTREDFTRSGERYDVIFDTQLNHSLAAYRRCLNRPGLLLVVGAGAGPATRLIGRLIRTVIGSKFTGPRTRFFVASIKGPDLLTLKGWVDEGKITPVVDRQYPLAHLPDAFQYLIEGHARGKIVVSM